MGGVRGLRRRQHFLEREQRAAAILGRERHARFRQRDLGIVGAAQRAVVADRAQRVGGVAGAGRGGDLGFAARLRGRRRAAPPSAAASSARDRLDGDERRRDVGRERPRGARRQPADRLEHLDAFRDAAEHGVAGVAPAVELRVVREIHEELRARRVRVFRARGRDACRACCASPLLDSFATGGSVERTRSSRSRPPPWTNSPGCDAMEHGARVVAHVDVAQEVRDVLRRRLVGELEHGAAAIRADGDFRRLKHSGATACAERHERSQAIVHRPRSPELRSPPSIASGRIERFGD